MTRRRRAALLLGLALVLGGLAAADVGRRESALRTQLGPLVDVVVARRPLATGERIGLSDLGVRRVPIRYAPAGQPAVVEALVGRRLAVPVAAGGALAPELLAQPATSGPPVRRGERAAEVVATAAPGSVVPGGRVDVLVTRDRGDGAGGLSRLALEDVEVLGARPAAPADGGDERARIDATLRVTVRQAVYLAAAQAFARDIRLLPRAPGDRGRVGALAIGEGL
jgi:pilus assembly protein CpaB